MNIIEVKEKLKEAFRDIPVDVLDKEEDRKWCEENDMEVVEYEVDYLIVMDADESMFMGGAYEVTCENGEFEALWLPYPDSPKKDIDIFIESVLTSKVRRS